MTVPGAHACRAAADDLNTALGGDLKLTTFGPRLPELSREVELGDFFGRRVFGEPLLVGAFRGDAPGDDGCMWRERNVACRNQENLPISVVQGSKLSVTFSNVACRRCRNQESLL